MRTGARHATEDKCASPGSSNCSANATCTNVPYDAGYTCSCGAGFTGEAYGGACTGARTSCFA